MIGWLGGVLGRAAKDLLYLLIGGVTAVLAVCIWTTGLGLSIGLAILIIGIPVIVLTAKVFRWTTELDRQNARLVLGGPVVGRYRTAGESGLWARSKATLTDPQTLRDTVWLIIHSIVGMTFAVFAISAIAITVGTAFIPIWNDQIPDEAAQWGPWPLGEEPNAWLFILASLPMAALTIVLLRGMALAEAYLAAALLGAPQTEAKTLEMPAAQTRPAVNYRAEVALPAHAAVAVFVSALCALLWLLTGLGTFWPIWVWLPLGLTVALHLVAVRYANAADRRERFRAVDEAQVAIVVFLIGVWAASGGGPFWPVWPALVFLLIDGLVVLVILAPWRDRAELSDRVAVLTRTRREAVDAQATELRRIERDLHDGAQARLVALSMQLGRAEARLSDRPEEAELIRQARGEASAAIAELRDLSRGIAPPVLVDRGLVAAVEALAGRSPMPVSVTANVEDRLPVAVENAAYFVCAEALTNAAKHAVDADVVICLERDAHSLLVSVHDTGPGGADAGGSGLTGLRQRVAALDGTLHVASASGQGTTISAELPCAS